MRVYVLLEPDSQVVRYVGLTKYSGEGRLRGHLNSKRRVYGANHAKLEWISDLLGMGKKPRVEVKHECIDKIEAMDKERDLIRAYMESGEPLLNLVSVWTIPQRKVIQDRGCPICGKHKPERGYLTCRKCIDKRKVSA